MLCLRNPLFENHPIWTDNFAALPKDSLLEGTHFSFPLPHIHCDLCTICCWLLTALPVTNLPPANNPFLFFPSGLFLNFSILPNCSPSVFTSTHLFLTNFPYLFLVPELKAPMDSSEAFLQIIFIFPHLFFHFFFYPLLHLSSRIPRNPFTS